MAIGRSETLYPGLDSNPRSESTFVRAQCLTFLLFQHFALCGTITGSSRRLNGDRGRGSPSKEYLTRVGSRDLLVDSYVSSYDISRKPIVTDDESMKSVKKNRCTLVESWCHSSSGGTEQLRVTKLRIRDEYDHKTAHPRLPRNPSQTGEEVPYTFL